MHSVPLLSLNLWGKILCFAPLNTFWSDLFLVLTFRRCRTTSYVIICTFCLRQVLSYISGLTVVFASVVWKELADLFKVCKLASEERPEYRLCLEAPVKKSSGRTDKLLSRWRWNVIRGMEIKSRSSHSLPNTQHVPQQQCSFNERVWWQWQTCASHCFLQPKGPMCNITGI